MANLLEMENITKSFPGVKALDDVQFVLKEGETHVLLGENGAGKSTLIKVLSGAYQQDEGLIKIGGEEADIESPVDAFSYGVNVIYQEFNLAPNLPICENIYLGRELVQGGGFVNKSDAREKTREVMEFVGLDEDPNTEVRNLTVAQRQLVEVCKALAFEANIIVFDEPTATLTDSETERLFEIIKNLKADGLGIIYISHRLDEFREVGDRVTVLRNGKYIDTLNLENSTKDQLISMMVGKELGEREIRETSKSTAKPVLEVENLSYEDEVKDVSFTLKEQEILGVAGLVGAGRTELAKTVIGEYSKEEGRVKLNGEEVKITSPADAMQNGIFYLSEDRKEEGLFLGHSVKKNITISSLEKVQNKILIDKKEEREISNDLIDKLNIKTPSGETRTVSLSGGNQQKVVVAKGLCNEANIYIFDESTRGIDVGAKEEIYKIIEELVREGDSIIMISSEIPELMRIADRILVMYHGKAVNIFDNDKDLSKQKILSAAMGETT